MKREWWADGPADDPDDALMDEIHEDEDFRTEWAAAHAWELVELLTTTDALVDVLRSRLRDQFYRDEYREMRERGNANV